MKTKIVYCLVSNNKDYYYEQLLISLCSLRKYNPDAAVFVVVDDKTYETLVDNRTKIFEYASEIIKIIPPFEFGNAMRSRYLKTNMRDIIDGDFLFIDTDTVICDSLDDIDDCEYEIGAVYDNHHGNIIEDQLGYLPEGHEWHSLRGSVHYNSGVFYVKDTPNAHEFYHKWFKYWQEGAKIGFLFDQVPLRKTLLESGKNYVGELPGFWNCQVFRADSKPYWENAKILHCQGIAPNVYFPMTAAKVYEDIKTTGNIPSDIQNMLGGDKKNLLKKNIVIYGRDIEYFESPMHDICFDYPSFFSFLVKVSSMYRSLVSITYNAKVRFMHFLTRK